MAVQQKVQLKATVQTPREAVRELSVRSRALASSTVGELVEHHGFGRPKEAMGELAKSARTSKDFSSFFKGSMGLALKHGAAEGSLDYALGLLKGSGSAPFNPLALDSGKAQLALKAGKMSSRDFHLVNNWRNFYQLAKEGHPALKDVIKKLKG